jgi:hypothetical protein
MAEGSRFASLEDNDMLKLIDDKDAKSTKNVIAGAASIFHEYLTVTNGQFKTIEDIEAANITDVSGTLRKCYAEIRKTDGELYAPKSLMTIRFGLQKHFIQKRNEDIINDVGYAEANTMFKAMLVHIKKEGEAGVNHKDSISTEESLQKRVFFEYMYYFCNRGRENIRDVQKDDFDLKNDAKGLRYVLVKVSRQTKNHIGDDLMDKDDKDGRITDV